MARATVVCLDRMGYFNEGGNMDYKATVMAHLTNDRERFRQNKIGPVYMKQLDDAISWLENVDSQPVAPQSIPDDVQHKTKRASVACTKWRRGGRRLTFDELDDAIDALAWLDSVPVAPTMDWTDAPTRYRQRRHRKEIAMQSVDSQPVAPEPDWSTAPDNAEYYAVDANGHARWFEAEPYRTFWDQHQWDYLEGTNWWSAGRICLPISVDWRQTYQQRPQETVCNQ